MDQHSVQVIIETLKEEGVDLAVTLPEEPTFSLTEAMRQDPFFQAVTVAGEGNGLAFCAGACAIFRLLNRRASAAFRPN